MTFYDRLVAEVEGEREAFLALPIIQAGMRGEFSRETYIGYLSEAFHHVRHTVPLIETVRCHIPPERAALLDALSDYSLKKKGHEKWILQDIGHAGGDAETVRTGSPAPATEEFLAYVYHYVEQVNPIGFFGVLYIVEGTGSALATCAVEQLMKTLGLPKNCFSYLLSHGSPELQNMDFFQVLMAQITDSEAQKAIIEVAKEAYGLYGDIFQSIAQQSGFDKTVAN